MTEFAVDRPYAILVAAVLTFVVSLAGARLAMHSDTLLDDPNHRSSHDAAVSRAGGLAMLAALLAGLFVIGVFSGGQDLAAPALKFMALAVFAGGVGLADDQLDLRPLVKFAGQFLAGLGFVWLLGPLQTAPLPFLGETALGFFGVFVTVFWIVAFINVFNFMDGVNGIAAGAAFVGLSLFALAAVFTGATAAAVIALLAALAAAGFLPANVVRGRLFMGDCGSHFLAFVIAGLGVFAANASNGAASALLMPVIFLPFIIDVAFTLIHRSIRGQNVLTAHREHAYQLILRQGASHGAVAAIFSGLVAFCAAAAILMLALPPSLMWAAPAAIAAVGFAAAAALYIRARKDGLLADA